MKINVNYYYTQEYLPTRRHRKTRIRELNDTVTVNTTELTAEEFPVAIAKFNELEKEYIK